MITPGNAIKKPKTADVPTHSWIFFENMLKVGTLKLPPPIPIKTDKKPIVKLIKKFKLFDLGRSFPIKIGCCCNPIFKDIVKAKQIKIITNISPDILLASKDPRIDPIIMPNIHFLTI